MILFIMVKIEEDTKLDFSDVLIKPKRSTISSRSEVDLNRLFKSKHSNVEWLGVPIVVSNMDTTGTFEMFLECQKHRIITCIHKHYSIEEWTNFMTTNDELINFNYLSLSTGISDADFEKNKLIMHLYPSIKMICIDVANGYSEKFVDKIRIFRKEFPDKIIFAGNVVTSEMTEQLILAGADVVKVGIGPGSVCTTRIQTGVGYPQLSAVMECADAAHGLGGHIIADGGCVCPGDVAKAFAGGADFVMLGGMLAGHDEGGGQVITKRYKTQEMMHDGINHVFDEKQFVQFYGMSSEAANEKHFGGLKEYRSSEGREVLVPYRGAVESTVRDLLGGIRSSCTYVGANKLKHLPKCATFIRCADTHNRVFE